MMFLLTLGILIMLILIYLELLRMRERNRVVVPSLTVVVDQASYLHGDTVKISGALLENEVPVPDQTLTVALPDGTTQQTTTDKDGKYSVTWIVPDSVSGVLTIRAMALGITAATTFTPPKFLRGDLLFSVKREGLTAQK